MGSYLRNLCGIVDEDDVVLPSDLAVRLVENLLTPVGEVRSAIDREAILARARTFADEQVEWWVNQVLGQLCTHGYVHRERGERGLTGYRASAQWSKRDEVLSSLRRPRERVADRRRPRLARSA